MTRDNHPRIVGAFMLLVILSILAIILNFSDLKSEGALRIREVEIDWGNIFDEPYEIIAFIYKDLRHGITFDTREEYRVNLHPSRMIQEMKLRGKTLKDVAFIIHNHPIATGFTTGDNIVFSYFRAEGFNGQFAIYYPFNTKTRVKKDE